MAFIINCLVVFIVITGCSRSSVETALMTPTASSIPGQSPVSGHRKRHLQLPDPHFEPLADAAEVVAKASQAVSNLHTYVFDRAITVVRSASVDESDKTTTSINGKTGLNLSTRDMQMYNGTYVKLASGQMAGSMIENSIYIVNNIMYIQGLFPNEPQMWIKTALTESIWQVQDQARQMVELLQPQNVTVLAPESIRKGDMDISCDVLQVSPDLKKLWGLMAGQPGIQLPPKRLRESLRPDS